MVSAHQHLIGRDAELATLLRGLDEVAAGGMTVSVHGEAGVGKSTLLAVISEEARRRRFHVLSGSGSDLEAGLPFAVLHQLLRPVLDGAAALPARQREALLGAFGLSDAHDPEPFLVALAALQILVDRGEHHPVLLAVDDAHWLDRPSRDALNFIARRIQLDPIVILTTHRDGHQAPFPIPATHDLVVGPLDAVASARLLDTTMPALDAAARGRLLSEAAGNPLALIELARGISATPRPDGRLPMSARLEAAFSARAASLTPASQIVALVVAADRDSGIDLVRAAAARIVGSPAAADAALADLADARLISIDAGEVRFRHPLMRSAVYHDAADTDRHRAHLALAEGLRHDPDRRAWHLASGIDGHDDEVAAVVEAAARRAWTRGTHDAALSGLQRAAELTSAAAPRSRRWLTVAEASLEAGRPDQARVLLSRVDIADLTARQQARLLLLRHETGTARPGERSTVLGLVETARDVADGGDPELAIRFVEAAALSAWWADPGDDVRLSVLAAGRKLVLEPNDSRLLSVYAHTDPHGHGREVVEQASRLIPAQLDLDTVRTLAKALGTLGAFHVSAAFQDAAVIGLRERGSLHKLPEALTDQAWTAITMMNRTVAITAADECVRLAEETGQPLWTAAAKCGQAMLAALRGDFSAAQLLADEAETLTLPLQANAVLCGIQLARGTAALGSGRYDDAYADLRRVFDPADPAHHHFQSLWAVGDFAEAASHTGRKDEAHQLLDQLDPGSSRSWHSWVAVAFRYAEPLLADDDNAEKLYVAALTGELAQWPAYRARLLLEYGSWARRRRHIRAARSNLRAAREACDALGMAPWADRARRELRAAGEPSADADVEPWTELSPQELQIAQLAAQGLTNRQIAQRLFISHRTVSTHLYRIFPKLGVTTRNALVRHLAAAPVPEPQRSPEAAGEPPTRQ